MRPSLRLLVSGYCTRRSQYIGILLQQKGITDGFDTVYPRTWWHPTGEALACPVGRRFSSDDDAGGERRRQRLNRLMYHAKQRGWLELDVLLGEWAEKNLDSLSSARLDDFEELLGIENPDMFKCLTGQLQPGPELQDNAVFRMIQQGVQARMDEYSAVQPKGRREWVRGWDDGHPRGDTTS